MAGQLRAAIYCRVSTEQQEADGTSLDTQEQRCRAYCAEHGYEVAAVFVDVFTGARYRERPGLTALREQVRAGLVDVAVAYAVDRLSRNQAHLAILVEEITEHGARLEFVTEEFENSAVGRFILSAKAFAAEVEREKIAERSVRGKIARIQSGKLLPGYKPLYGYRWTAGNTAYAIDEATAPIVRRMFDEAAGGKTVRAIARGLTGDGIPTPSGKPAWAPKTVHTLLRHPSYAGLAYGWAWRSTGPASTKHFDAEQAIPLPPGTIPAIVEPALWHEVQRRLALNKQLSPRNNRSPHVALLRGGFARCGYCGRAMRVLPRKGRAPSYQCGGCTNPVRPCHGHCITVPALDNAVWQGISQRLLDPDLIAREVERLRRDDPTRADLAAVTRRLAEVERRQGNLRRELAAEDNPDVAALIRADLAQLAAERRALDEELARIDAERQAWLSAQQRLEDLEYWIGNVARNLEALDYQGRREVLIACDVRVDVWATDHTPRWQVTMRLGNEPVIVSPSSAST